MKKKLKKLIEANKERIDLIAEAMAEEVENFKSGHISLTGFHMAMKGHQQDLAFFSFEFTVYTELLAELYDDEKNS